MSVVLKKETSGAALAVPAQPSLARRLSFLDR
jgi:hypothetical protein